MYKNHRDSDSFLEILQRIIDVDSDFSLYSNMQGNLVLFDKNYWGILKELYTTIDLVSFKIC